MWRLIICNDRYDFRKHLLLFTWNPPTYLAGPEAAPALFRLYHGHTFTMQPSANELLNVPKPHWGWLTENEDLTC